MRHLSAISSVRFDFTNSLAETEYRTHQARQVKVNDYPMKRVAEKALIAEITEAEVHVYDRAMTPVRQAPVYHTCITCTHR